MTATENLLLAAVLARGTTVIDNAAREPEIADLALFLTAMGAQVDGAGTSTIEIAGRRRAAGRRSTRRSPTGSRSGTWAAAAVATLGDVTIANAQPEHLDLLLTKLADAGADDRDERRRACASARRPAPRAMDFVTLPYPGIATDFQPILLAMLAVADGTSIVTENVFEGRFLYVGELQRMGADIRTEGHHAVVRGVPQLSAAPVRALDIRAGMALVIAALCADGETEIADVHHIDRGYEDLEGKLRALGADVRREGDAVVVPGPGGHPVIPQPPGRRRPRFPSPPPSHAAALPTSRAASADPTACPSVDWSSGQGAAGRRRHQPRARAGRRRRHRCSSPSGSPRRDDLDSGGALVYVSA